MKELDEHRAEIDAIDKELVKLLNQRAKAALSIGEIKKRNNCPVWVPEREKAIFDRLKTLSKGPIPYSSIHNIFREIISSCISLEQKMKVGYFGLEGAFANMAALKRFGTDAELEPMGGVRDVFDAVEKNRVKYGVIPIENTIEGIVNYSIDMFIDTNLFIVGEIFMEISQNLLNKTGNKKDIQHVYSHPHAIAQCRKWLYKNMPNIPVSTVESTAKAALMAMDDKSVAAIGSSMAEKVYNLKIIENHIEDEPLNYTRFLIIGKEEAMATGNDTTSIVFGLKHEPGSLCDALEILKKSGINMTKLESRPSKRKPWEYWFYVTIDGHKNDENIQNALGKVNKNVSMIKILGSYPKGEL